MIDVRNSQYAKERVSDAPASADREPSAQPFRLICAYPGQVQAITQLHRAAIARVPTSYYDEPSRAAWWRTPAKGIDELIAGGRYYVIMSGDHPLAGAGWQPADEPQAALLRAVFVDPAMAGQGLGAKCVSRVEVEVLKAGFTRLLVPAALNAVGFYQRLGYDLIGWGREEMEPGIVLSYRRMAKRLAQL